MSVPGSMALLVEMSTPLRGLSERGVRMKR